MACNECDGDGVGHSPQCALSLHEKLDLVVDTLKEILDIQKQLLQLMVDNS